jgi:rare lipoprotein A
MGNLSSLKESFCDTIVPHSVTSAIVLIFASFCFFFANASDYPMQGVASWYHARRTASGERFSDATLTCAMRRRDYGKLYKVCNRDNGKCVVVRQNNFGPSKKLYNKGRIIDLSKAAFRRLADLKKGVIRVTVTEVDKNSR